MPRDNLNQNNPYAPPSSTATSYDASTTTGPMGDELPFVIDPADRKKLDTVIKDAGQFWLAIVFCFFCTIAALIIPFWYMLRLFQWSGLAKKYPDLLVDGAPTGSIQAKFRSSQWKLIVGMLVAGCVLVLLLLYIVLLVVIETAG